MRPLNRWTIGANGQEVEGSDITSINRMCWRGDSRGPTDIFNFGFRRRDDTLEGYFNRLDEWEDDPSQHTVNEYGEVRKMPPSNPLFRSDSRDIAPATAVCVAGSFKAAALFPLKGDASTDKIWVYAVQVENGFDTYQMQARIGAKKTLFVQEACSHDIPPMHVLGVIRVRRNWLGKTWEDGAMGRVTKPFEANPKSVGCVGRAAKLQAAANEIKQALYGDMFMIGP